MRTAAQTLAIVSYKDGNVWRLRTSGDGGGGGGGGSVGIEPAIRGDTGIVNVGTVPQEIRPANNTRIDVIIRNMSNTTKIFIGFDLAGNISWEVEPRQVVGFSWALFPIVVRAESGTVGVNWIETYKV